MCVNILLFCRDSLLIFSLGDKRYYSTPKIFAPYCWPFTREDQKVGTFSQCGGCRPRSCNNTLWYCDQWAGPVFPRGLEIAQWRYKGVLRCQIYDLNLFPFPWNSVIGLSITAVRCLATTRCALSRNYDGIVGCLALDYCVFLLSNLGRSWSICMIFSVDT